MKQFLMKFILPWLLAAGTVLYGQDGNKLLNHSSVTYGSGKPNRVYVPPPKEFMESAGRKGAGITVYYTGFTASAKTAFQYAVDILQSVLPKNVSFTIKASWAPISTTGVLAQSGATDFIPGSQFNAPRPDVYYPIALAEKISGEKFNNDTDGDIVMTVNSGTSWYTGTNGIVPVGKYDLVTVVLHELCHGLGFISTFSTNASSGTRGDPSLIYDTFVEDGSGHGLTDPAWYTNNSGKLYTALTGNNIYFRGKVLQNRVKLYAPSTWDSGSSISHINENSVADSLALMTPFIGFQEAIHNPGSITRSILADLGWIDTRIFHKPFTDTEDTIATALFKTVVRSDTSFDRNHVGLVWSTDRFITSDTSWFVPPSSDDTFRLALGIPSYNTRLSYYIIVTDYFNRVYQLPSTAPGITYEFTTGTDTIKPVVSHRPPPNVLDIAPSVRLSAEATDNIGVDSVYIEYRKNDGAFLYSGMTHDSANSYSCKLRLKELQLTGSDSVQYRIIARDSSSMANKGYSPSTGYHTVKVQETLGIVSSYNTTFSNSSGDFINNGFSIITLSGFPDPALHTTHPYASPERDNDSIVYTSVLKHPVKTDSAGLVMTWKEVVLVEPGEAGSVYGSPDFYDYVVVEASRNFGTDWFPLEAGYDSRISAIFLHDYNSAITGSNSTFKGTASLYEDHMITSTTFTKFSKGDTLLIRFRLFSDPYAHGWGWVIDDLSIRSILDAVPENKADQMNLYPNPGDGNIYIQTVTDTRPVRFEIVMISGKPILKGQLNPGDAINISDQPPGIYFIIISRGNMQTIMRYAKIR